MPTDAIAAFVAGLALGSLVLAWWARRRQAHARAVAQRSLREARQELEAELSLQRQLSNRLATVEQLVDEALVYVAADDTVTGASPAAMQWFGLSASGPAGRRPPTTMAALHSIDLAAMVAHATKGPVEPQRLRIGDRLLFARAAPLPEGGVVLALRDVTNVERLARARRDLVSNVSHDLRTPLTSLGLLVEALTASVVTQSDPAQTLVARIGEQVALLNGMVQVMLDLDRIESGHAAFRLRPVLLLRVAKEAVAALGPQTEQRQVTIMLHVPADLWVLADVPYLRRGLTNLLQNAVQHSPAGGQVVMQARRRAGGTDGFAVIEVLDEGSGIPPADLERVFERFYRSERSRAGAGSGLGLAITRHIVEGHGGEIEARNRAERGAVIRFSLPICAPGTGTDLPGEPPETDRSAAER